MYHLLARYQSVNFKFPWNQLRKKGSPNRALSLYLGSIRHLFNEAKKHYNDYDRNIILIGSSPFENFKILKQEVTRKRAISAELIKQIYRLPYLYNCRGKEIQGRYNLAKDCFLLSFCLIGINSADLYNCTELDSNVIPIIESRLPAEGRLFPQKFFCAHSPGRLPAIHRHKQLCSLQIYGHHSSKC